MSNTYKVYDRMNPDSHTMHLRMITSDKTEVEDFIAGEEWRYEVVTTTQPRA
jgi:hypothetical protein